MNGASVDILTLNSQGGASASGSIAQRLLQTGMNPAKLRTNGVLRNREWIQVDTTVVNVARQRLIGVADLLSAGLRMDIPDALGVTRIEWERVSDFGTADVNMSAITETKNERVNYDLIALPLPIVHKDFQINIRALESSRRMGQPLDTTQTALATRIVAEKIENMLFNGGYSAGAGNGTIYGYTTFPDRVTGTLTGNWGQQDGANRGLATNGDLLNMIGALVAKNMFGPYMVYVSMADYTGLSEDYKANSDLTVLQRLKEIPGIIDIKPASFLATGNVVVVQFTQDVVDMIVGFQPMAVSWEEMGGMVTHFKVMSIMVPRMKSDQTTQVGIAHYHYP